MKKANGHRWLALALLIIPCLCVLSVRPQVARAQMNVCLPNDPSGSGELGDPDIPSTRMRSPGYGVVPGGRSNYEDRSFVSMNDRNQTAVVPATDALPGRAWLRGVLWFFKTRLGW